MKARKLARPHLVRWKYVIQAGIPNMASMHPLALTGLRCSFSAARRRSPIIIPAEREASTPARSADRTFSTAVTSIEEGLRRRLAKTAAGDDTIAMLANPDVSERTPRRPRITSDTGHNSPSPSTRRSCRRRIPGRHVGHRGRRRSAMPVLQSRRKPHDVAGANFLDRAALTLCPSEPCSDNQRLAEWMRVPGGPGAGLERHLAGADPSRIRSLEQGSMRTVPVNQSSEPFCEGRDPFLLISISI
jgi:hypothetical protein